jgi:hypothetical protein
MSFCEPCGTDPIETVKYSLKYPRLTRQRELSDANENLNGRNRLRGDAHTTEFVQTISEKIHSALLQMHYRYGHASFRRLHMAHVGCIPKRLSKCAIPVHAACGKAHKRPKIQRQEIRPRATPGSQTR